MRKSDANIPNLKTRGAYHAWLMEHQLTLKHLEAILEPYRGDYEQHPEDPRIIITDKAHVYPVFQKHNGIKALLIPRSAQDALKAATEINEADIENIPEHFHASRDRKRQISIRATWKKHTPPKPTGLAPEIESDIIDLIGIYNHATGLMPRRSDIITLKDGNFGGAIHFDSASDEEAQRMTYSHLGSGTRLFLQNDQTRPFHTETAYAALFRGASLATPEECAMLHQATNAPRLGFAIIGRKPITQETVNEALAVTDPKIH